MNARSPDKKKCVLGFEDWELKGCLIDGFCNNHNSFFEGLSKFWLKQKLCEQYIQSQFPLCANLSSQSVIRL